MLGIPSIYHHFYHQHGAIDQYHLDLNSRLSTAGFAKIKPATNAAMVNNNCVLLKASERMSNVPDGVMRLPNRSRPYAKRSDVDSRRAGEATTCLVPISCGGGNRKGASVSTCHARPHSAPTHVIGMRQGPLWIRDQ